MDPEHFNYQTSHSVAAGFGFAMFTPTDVVVVVTTNMAASVTTSSVSTLMCL